MQRLSLPSSRKRWRHSRADQVQRLLRLQIRLKLQLRRIPITKLKMKSQGGDAPQKLKMTPKAAPEAEPKPAAFTGKSAQAAQEEEEEELIIGEVEEGVKRNQVLIGDGDEDADFEFL